LTIDHEPYFGNALKRLLLKKSRAGDPAYKGYHAGK